MRVCVIGLGIIGGVWARHLASDGHQLRTWNRTPQPDAPGFTPDLRAAVAAAELVMIVVADPPAVAGVLEVIIPVLAPGAVVAQHSTVGVDDTRTYAKLVAGAGGRFIDMPFTGSKLAAEARQNVFFVGDDAGVLGAVEPVYRRLSKALQPIGGIGAAMAIKLCFNVLIANLNQAYSESYALAMKSGISADTFFAALSQTVSQSPLVELKKPKYISGDYSPQFSIKHMHKDLRLALVLAAAAGLELPETQVVERAYAEAARRGMGDLDFSALLEIVRSGGRPHLFP